MGRVRSPAAHPINERAAEDDVTAGQGARIPATRRGEFVEACASEDEVGDDSNDDSK